MTQEFYVLKGRGGFDRDAGTEFVQHDPVNLGDAPRCPACGQYLGMRAWLPPYRVELITWGAQYGDLAFDSGSGFLMTTRFQVLYAAAGLKGLSDGLPVEIVRRIHHGRQLSPPPAIPIYDNPTVQYCGRSCKV